MPNVHGTTRAQTLFLRAFRQNPYGPPPDQWPSPVVLRRWLKRRGFCAAMDDCLRAMRYQADFHLTAAAASGAHLLHSAVHAGDVEAARKQIEALITLLRMAHVRHRFAEPLPKAEPRTSDLIAMLQISHPDITVRRALECLDVLEDNDEGRRTWARTGHRGWWEKDERISRHQDDDIADDSPEPKL